MVLLSGGDVVEEGYQFLANQVLTEERKVLDGAEDDRIGEDGGVEQMGGKGR